MNLNDTLLITITTLVIVICLLVFIQCCCISSNKTNYELISALTDLELETEEIKRTLRTRPQIPPVICANCKHSPGPNPNSTPRPLPQLPEPEHVDDQNSLPNSSDESLSLATEEPQKSVRFEGATEIEITPLVEPERESVDESLNLATEEPTDLVGGFEEAVKTKSEPATETDSRLRQLEVANELLIENIAKIESRLYRNKIQK